MKKLAHCFLFFKIYNSDFIEIKQFKLTYFYSGISMRSKVSFNKNQVQLLPFTLLPSSFPRKNFEKAKGIQVLLNELIHKVAYDNNFLIQSLKRYIKIISYLYLYLYVL